MRKVTAAIHQALAVLARSNPSVSGAELRVRLHPSDYEQLLVEFTPQGPTPYLGADHLRMHTALGTATVETHPGYAQSVAAVMVLDVMDPAGIRPLSHNETIYEHCDVCEVSRENVDIAQCSHALTTGCSVWLCETCQDGHEEKEHLTPMERTRRSLAEKRERLAETETVDLTDADYADRMRERRALREGKMVVKIEGGPTIISDQKPRLFGTSGAVGTVTEVTGVEE